jgi:hypothetical protein
MEYETERLVRTYVVCIAAKRKGADGRASDDIDPTHKI